MVTALPSAEVLPARLLEAEAVLESIHDKEYIVRIKTLCERNATRTSPFDEDTYLSRYSYEVCLLAMSAWMDAVDEVLTHKNTVRKTQRLSFYSFIPILR